MNLKKMKLGIAPIGWTNDDMPELGGENTFEQCISEMALAGYKGCEVGSKFPSEINKLKKALRLRGLKIANRWFSSFLLTKPYEEVEKEFCKQCRFLKSLGAKVIGVSEQSYSTQGKDEPIFGSSKYVMNDEEWKTLTEGLNKLGNKALEYGINLTFHHHMGTVVQTEAEIDRLMQNTDSRYFSLLYDCGHLAYCGEDYLSVLKKYISRIKHVHLKDVRLEVVERVKKEDKSFLEGVRAGTFTVPGDGNVNFKSILEEFKNTDYDRWFIIEAEQDPAIANPLEYAKKGMKYIKSLQRELENK